MILFFLYSVIRSNEKTVLWKEGCYDHWFPETSNWLWMIIKRQDICYIDGGDTILLALHVTDKDFELTIILIWYTKHVRFLVCIGAIITLRDLIHFQIFTMNDLSIKTLESVQRVASNLEMGVIFVRNTLNSLGILGHVDVDNIKLGINPGSNGEPFEKFTHVSFCGLELLKTYKSCFLLCLRWLYRTHITGTRGRVNIFMFSINASGVTTFILFCWPK